MYIELLMSMCIVPQLKEFWSHTEERLVYAKVHVCTLIQTDLKPSKGLWCDIKTEIFASVGLR